MPWDCFKQDRIEIVDGKELTFMLFRTMTGLYVTSRTGFHAFHEPILLTLSEKSAGDTFTFRAFEIESTQNLPFFQLYTTI